MPAHAWAPISATLVAAVARARLLGPAVVVKAIQTRPFCLYQSALRPSSRGRLRGERPTSIESVLAADSRCPAKQREMRGKFQARRTFVSRLFSFACPAYLAQALRTAVILKHEEEKRNEVGVDRHQRIRCDALDKRAHIDVLRRRSQAFRGTVVVPSFTPKWDGARIVTDLRRFLHKGLMGGVSFGGVGIRWCRTPAQLGNAQMLQPWLIRSRIAMTVQRPVPTKGLCHSRQGY